MKFKNLLLLGLTVSMAVSCSSDPKMKEGMQVKEGELMAAEEAAAEPIVKTWALDNIDASAAMAGMPEQTRAQMKAMMDQMAAEQRGKMTLDIQAGGKVVTNSPDIEGKWRAMEGKWSLGADNKTLTIDMKGGGKKDEYIIQELTDDKLKLEMKDDKLSMVFTAKK